jgi:hypothetical protein
MVAIASMIQACGRTAAVSAGAVLFAGPPFADSAFSGACAEVISELTLVTGSRPEGSLERAVIP